MRGAPATPPSSHVSPPSYPEPRQISSHVLLQVPLSRRKKGPGLILVLDHYALVTESEKNLDPPPLRKWAEEGFAVVQLLLPGNVEDGGEFPIQKALSVLKSCEECDFGNGVGLISYISRLPYYVEEAICLTPEIKALISYGGRKVTTISESVVSIPSQLIHIAGTDLPRRESISGAPELPSSAQRSGTIKSYRYNDAARDSGWMLPNDEEYHKNSANLAHARSLAFLKPLLHGPFFNLEDIWDDHFTSVFVEQDIERAMAMMVQQPFVNYVPTMAGGVGSNHVSTFYTKHFFPSNFPETKRSLISRTIGTDCVIDQFIFRLTHAQEIPWMLPGIPPTNRKLEILFTSTAAFRGDRISQHLVSWDQGTVLEQLGLMPKYVDFPYEIDGVAAPKGKKYQVLIPVAGVDMSRKVKDEKCVDSHLSTEKNWMVVDEA